MGRSEQRSDYFATGLILSTAYDNNVVGGANAKPASEVSYIIWPTVTLDRVTTRQHTTFTYSPGFTFYQPTSALDEVDQDASVEFQYQPSAYAEFIVRDSLQKSSNVFNQPDPLSGVSLSGSTQSPPEQVIAPFAERISNTTDMALSYQFNRNQMIGAGGIASELNYPNSAEASNFYNSDSRGGSAFYSNRRSSTQYIGVTYQYLWTQANPVVAQTNPANLGINTKTQSYYPFYTNYLNRALSVSMAAGPQYFDVASSLSQPVRSWTPAAIASIGWQGSRTACSANYIRTVTGGIGVSGAFESNNANTLARWQVTRTWIVGTAVSYAVNKNVSPLLPTSIPGGHTIAGSVTLQHLIGKHYRAELGYAHLHQSYSGIAIIAADPDSDRVYFSLSYQLTRPLGR
jgi:hypothetical protein